jgi:hypothetical protein
MKMKIRQNTVLLIKLQNAQDELRETPLNDFQNLIRIAKETRELAVEAERIKEHIKLTKDKLVHFNPDRNLN